MAIYTLRTGATAHPEDSVLQFFTDLVASGGVRDLSADNHLKIVQRAAGANMSVDIGTGRGIIKGSGNAYPVRNTTAINAAVTSNSSGNPRKDAVVLYIDLAESPTTTADDVVKSAVVAGTPAASPVAPDDSAIQTAVGGSNPFLRLANVTVINNETTIENSDIEDVRVAFKILEESVPDLTTNRITKRVDTVTSSATPTINTDNVDMFTITALATAITSMTTNLSGTPTEGQSLIIRIKDNGTARAITWGASFVARGATLPTTTVLSKYLYIGFIYNSVAAIWDCVAVVQEV